jgi:predicted nuclease of restriction endonuclease-like RecB superfamily
VTPAVATATQPTVLPRAGRPLALLDEADLGWIDAMLDVVVRHVGEPWRVALDEIEAGAWLPSRPHAAATGSLADARTLPPRAASSASLARAASSREPTPRRINAAVAAVRRLLGGRAYHASLARKARALVLGVPALDADARQARLAAAGLLLGLAARDIEQALWADLPLERPIELPRGRPPAADVAAHANVGLVQRSLRRAHAVELRIRGDAGPLLRAVAARGLIAVTSVELDGTTVFDIAGPLALCHRTSVYGRALGGLVPLLGSCDDFEMQIRAEARGQTYELAIASPALLPALPPPRPWKLVGRLARDLEKLGFVVARAPAPIASAHGIVCPDLRVEAPHRVDAAGGGETRGRIAWLEIIGFWTPEYLARKIARYHAAGIRDVVLCVDGERACDTDDPPPGACVVQFTRRIDASALAQLLGGAPA